MYDDKKIRVIKTLLAYGADKNMVSRNGNTAYQIFSNNIKNKLLVDLSKKALPLLRNSFKCNWKDFGFF